MAMLAKIVNNNRNDKKFELLYYPQKINFKKHSKRIKTSKK